ncbi:MAG: transferase hexapeptide repeat containing protein [Planctomycetes bacterium]|nr:transferase hexapeptide repeat containing protein [Planctomycetota bacterium]
MATATIEQRMTALEEAVRELQDAINPRRPAPDWLDRVIGSMKNEPAFDEVLAHGRASREADRPGRENECDE